MAKKLWSIFTDDLSTCYISGYTTGIEVHHIFESRMGFKKKSEEMGYIVPLHRSIHPNGVHCSDPNWKRLDHKLKRKCQEHFMEHGGTRTEWYEMFGRYHDFDID